MTARAAATTHAQDFALGADRRPDARGLPEGGADDGEPRDCRGVGATAVRWVAERPGGGERDRVRAYLRGQRPRVGRAIRRDLLRHAAGRAQAADTVPARRRGARRSRCTRSWPGTPTRTTQRVYRWLLERNLKLYGVAFAVDHLGRHLPGRPGAAARRSRRRRSTGCSARCWTYADDVVQHDPGARVRAPRSARSASGGVARGESTRRTSTRSGAGWSHRSTRPDPRCRAARHSRSSRPSCWSHRIEGG